MKRQRGMGFAGVLALLVGIIFLAIIGMKMVPAYIEYFAIKKAVAAITQGGQLRNATVADVRKAFELRQAIDDFTSVGPKDLEITKDGNEIVISFAYEKRIPLFYNISVLIDFAGSSQPTSTKAAD
jgi:Domain of unknown function (DUF4845)